MSGTLDWVRSPASGFGACTEDDEFFHFVKSVNCRHFCDHRIYCLMRPQMIPMYRIKNSSKETMNKKKVMFYDTTLRDGVQSLWAMKMTYGMIDAVAGEIDKAGYNYIELPVNAVNAKMQVRFLKENPWEIARLLGRKITRTKKPKC